MKRLVCLLLSLVMLLPALALAESDPIAERIQNLLTGDDLGYTILDVSETENMEDGYSVYAEPSYEICEVMTEAYRGADAGDYQDWVKSVGKMTALTVKILKMEGEVLKVEGIRPVTVTFFLVLPPDSSNPETSVLLIVQADTEENIEVLYDSTGVLEADPVNFDE